VISLTIYSKPGCHLCDDMKAVVERTVRSMPFAVVVEEIDISQDDELRRRYGEEIPVLLVNGARAAKYRIAEEDLKRILKGRAGTAGE
jgi:glutaredoxin